MDARIKSAHDAESVVTAIRLTDSNFKEPSGIARSARSDAASARPRVATS
jgi:hypothetical protein